MTRITTNTTAQASAIAAMAEALTEYNRGVLAMLGLDAVAQEYCGAVGQCARISQMRVKYAEEHDLPLINDGTPYDAEQEQANERARAAWKPIQALKDQARAYLDSAPDAPTACGMHI